MQKIWKVLCDTEGTDPIVLQLDLNFIVVVFFDELLSQSLIFWRNLHHCRNAAYKLILLRWLRVLL